MFIADVTLGRAIVNGRAEHLATRRNRLIDALTFRSEMGADEIASRYSRSLDQQAAQICVHLIEQVVHPGSCSRWRSLSHPGQSFRLKASSGANGCARSSPGT